MRSAGMMTILVAAIALAGCEQGSPPVEEKATEAAASEAPAATAASSNAAVTEPGSGTYATDCKTKDKSYAIALSKDANNMVVGEVSHAGKTFSNQLTSYSFMGDGTPTDFLVAVMFDAGNAPDGVNADEGRIEIWKGEAAYYALIDGDKSKKLLYCAN